MITLSQINQFANTNNISKDTDIFSILSMMPFEYKVKEKIPAPPTPLDTHIEWTTEEVIALFST